MCVISYKAESECALYNIFTYMVIVLNDINCIMYSCITPKQILFEAIKMECLIDIQIFDYLNLFGYEGKI